MSSIQPVSWTDPASYVQANSATSGASSKPSDVPENVFAPPGVFARLTATLQAYKTNEVIRPDVVVKGQQLAKSDSYPSLAEMSQVADQLLGTKDA